MPNRGDRGGAATRARIAGVATRLFTERGFDAVTVNEVAAAAGVSKVTVFAHFDRKEDLLLDRLPAAVEAVADVVRGRPDGVDPVEALHRAALETTRQRHPLSGLSDGATPLLRTVMGSPALLTRLREFERQVEERLGAELGADPAFDGDPALTAALVVAAYRVVAVETARRRAAGDDLDRVADEQARRLDTAFRSVAAGLAAS